MEALGFVELLAAPATKRRWSDEAKGRIVNRHLIVPPYRRPILPPLELSWPGDLLPVSWTPASMHTLH